MTATEITVDRPRTMTSRSPLVQTLRDTWLIYQRSMTLALRQPVWIILGLMQPILYLLLFGPLLDGAMAANGAGGSAYNWFIPGLLIQTAMFGAAFVGFALVAELRFGVIERMRVTPMSRFAMLFGRSLRDVTILLAQAVLMIVLAVPFGLKVELGGVLVTMALLALIGLLFAPLSYTAALVLKSEDALAPLTQGIALPLLLLSGVLLPMQLAPDWLRTIASFNPLAHAVDAARALFNGHPGDPEVLIGVGVTAVLAALALALASRTFARANA
jgi:ABC-2 type transport system permease protein